MSEIARDLKIRFETAIAILCKSAMFCPNRVTGDWVEYARINVPLDEGEVGRALRVVGERALMCDTLFVDVHASECAVLISFGSPEIGPVVREIYDGATALAAEVIRH